MNVAARLTLDGLVRALRWKVHALAEDVEDDYRRGPDDEKPVSAGERTREPRDDRARR